MTNLNKHRRLWIALLISAVLLAGGSALAIAEDKTIILGQEDAATGDFEQDKKTASKLIREAYGAGQLTPSKFIYYGNWYGPGWWGGGEEKDKPGNKQPIDELDAIAQRHDFAYQVAEEQGKIHGPAEEARLKGLADEIAVRDANALPRNPLEWDPPAPDPDAANDYRKRIGFGFKHEADYYKLKAALEWKKAVDEGSTVTTSGMTKADLDRMAQDRAKTWFTGEGVRPLYRIALSASTDLIEEGGYVDIQATLVPVLNEGYQGPSPVGNDRQDREAFSPAFLTYSVVDGRASVSSTGEGTVRVTATKKLFGSTVGSTITVTASYDGDQVDVVEASLSFVVAVRTQLTVRATPNDVQLGFSNDKGGPCRTVEVVARLTTSGGDPVEGMTLNFARDDGSTLLIVTDSDGYAAMDSDLCPEDLDGELTSKIPFIVTTASGSVGDRQYIASSETVNVLLRGHETAIIRGRVVDKGRNDKPIGGAAITLTDPFGESHEATTSSDGTFTIHIGAQEDGLPQLPGTVTADGYEPGSFTATTSGKTYTVGLYPLEATLIGRIVNEDGGQGIDGSTVHVTSPFDQLLNTSGGEFTITGLYVGDTVTMRADAQNFRAYVKSGKITMQNPVVTFRLTEGKGEVSNVLEEEEATDEDKQQVADLNTLYSLMVWATPADPATLQSVTITAQIFPPKPGVSIEIQMHGTDDYASSITGSTDAMGRVILPIPGAASGVVDDIVAWIVGTSVKQRLRYSF